MKVLVELDGVKMKMVESQKALQVGARGPSGGRGGGGGGGGGVRGVHQEGGGAEKGPSGERGPSGGGGEREGSIRRGGGESLSGGRVENRYIWLTCVLSQEADNWTTLSAGVEEVFASQDLQKVSRVAMVTWCSQHLAIADFHQIDRNAAELGM